MLEENKTQNTPEPETKAKNQPVETASPEIENEIETPPEVISETEENIKTEPEIEPQQQTQQTEITPQPNFIQNLLIKARAKIQERKRKKLDKIMTLFDKPSPSTSSGQAITNKDIQKLLRTTRVSAFRYLNILERENRIKQVGKTGKSVFYTKI